jgi:hypothetical protein
MSSVFVVAAGTMIRIVAGVPAMATVWSLPGPQLRLSPARVMCRRLDVLGIFCMGVVHSTRIRLAIVRH